LSPKVTIVTAILFNQLLTNAESQVNRAVLVDSKQDKITLLNHGKKAVRCKLYTGQPVGYHLGLGCQSCSLGCSNREKKAEQVNASAFLVIAISPDGRASTTGKNFAHPT
jgi:hypothetical protein